jgi:hypothetical protein
LLQRTPLLPPPPPPLLLVRLLLVQKEQPPGQLLLLQMVDWLWSPLLLHRLHRLRQRAGRLLRQCC